MNIMNSSLVTETRKNIYYHQLQPPPLSIFERTDYGSSNRIELLS